MNRISRARLASPSGYTLVELLAALTILGILLAIAVPKFGGMVKVNHLDRTLDLVTADLTLARMQAVRRGRPVQLAINASGTAYVVVAGTDTIKTVRVTADYPGVTLSPAPGAVRFNSRGLLSTDSEGTVTTTKEGMTRSLTISGIGRIYRGN